MKENIDPLSRLLASKAAYPLGGDIPFFEFADFTELKLMLFDLGLGSVLEATIAAARKVAAQRPADTETSTVVPVRSAPLPPNSYNAALALGMLFVFVNDRTDIDGLLLLCLIPPGKEAVAAGLLGAMVMEFQAGYSERAAPQLELLELTKPKRN
jgi:hypothetical protein